MSYTPGEEIFQETAKGKTKIIKGQPEYNEGTAYIRSDREYAGDVVDEMSGIADDIFEEVGEAIPKAIRKGKAEGGRMGYAGGSKVVKGLASLIKKKFGDNAITTADKLPIPKKTLDREMFNAANNRLNKKRQLTKEEIQDYEMELGDSETWMSDGTVGEAENALKDYKSYQDDMFRDYKAGKLDPVAGDKSPDRKRFLEKKFEDMEGSGDKRLMTRDEVEELSTFDLGTEMQTLRDGKTKSIIPKDEYAEYKNDFNKEILNMSPEDLLRDEFPGIQDNLVRSILTDKNPQRIAEVKQTIREGMAMQAKGMGHKEIMELLKKSSRTKHASGGRVPLWLGGGLTAGKGLTREMLKFMARGSSHGKSPAEILRLMNPKQFEKILNEPKLTNKFSKDTGIMASDMIKDMIKKTKTDRTDIVEQLLSSARNIKKSDDNIITYKNQIIEEMVSKGTDRKIAEGFAETLSKSLLKDVGPKVTKQGLLELENIQKNLLTKDRQLNSSGGLARMLGE